VSFTPIIERKLHDNDRFVFPVDRRMTSRRVTRNPVIQSLSDCHGNLAHRHQQQQRRDGSIFGSGGGSSGGNGSRCSSSQWSPGLVDRTPRALRIKTLA
jgi:hypothetical protein